MTRDDHIKKMLGGAEGDRLRELLFHPDNRTRQASSAELRNAAQAAANRVNAEWRLEHFGTDNLMELTQAQTDEADANAVTPEEMIAKGRTMKRDLSFLAYDPVFKGASPAASAAKVVNDAIEAAVKKQQQPGENYFTAYDRFVCRTPEGIELYKLYRAVGAKSVGELQIIADRKRGTGHATWGAAVDSLAKSFAKTHFNGDYRAGLDHIRKTHPDIWAMYEDEGR